MKTPKQSTKNAVTTKATMIRFEVCEDGSGAPAVIECGGYRFAMDWLGQLKCNCITQSNQSPSDLVILTARALYRSKIKSLSPGWHSMNKVMYLH